MKSINEWLNEYGESHQNPTNKKVHFVCVPLIFFSIIGLLYCVKLIRVFGIEITLAHLMAIVVTIYYFSLSAPIAIGMILYSAFCLTLCYIIVQQGVRNLFMTSILIFIMAWIAQFYGHNIEGKKPSFLKDMQFLLIGPAWIMSFLLKKIGLSI